MTETTIDTKRNSVGRRFAGALLTAGLVGGFGGVAVAAPASATVDQASFNAGDTITAVTDIPAMDGDPDFTAVQEGENYTVESADSDFVTIYVGDEGGTRELPADNFELVSSGGGDNGNGSENGNGGNGNGADNGDDAVDDGDAGDDFVDDNGDTGNGGADVEIDIDEPDTNIEEEDIDIEVDEDAEVAEASLSLDVDAVAPGGSVLAYGEGYEPLEDVEFTLDGVPLGVVTADQNGLIEDNVNIPEDSEEGDFTFAGEGLSSGVSASTNLTVISDESGFVEIDEDMGEEVDIESGVIPGDAGSAAGLGALLAGGALIAGAGGYALYRSRQNGETATNEVQG